MRRSSSSNPAALGDQEQLLVRVEVGIVDDDLHLLLVARRGRRATRGHPPATPRRRCPPPRGPRRGAGRARRPPGRSPAPRSRPTAAATTPPGIGRMTMKNSSSTHTTPNTAPSTATRRRPVISPSRSSSNSGASSEHRHFPSARTTATANPSVLTGRTLRGAPAHGQRSLSRSAAARDPPPSTRSEWCDDQRRVVVASRLCARPRTDRRFVAAGGRRPHTELRLVAQRGRPGSWPRPTDSTSWTT